MIDEFESQASYPVSKDITLHVWSNMPTNEDTMLEDFIGVHWQIILEVRQPHTLKYAYGDFFAGCPLEALSHYDASTIGMPGDIRFRSSSPDSFSLTAYLGDQWYLRIRDEDGITYHEFFIASAHHVLHRTTERKGNNDFAFKSSSPRNFPDWQEVFEKAPPDWNFTLPPFE